MRGRKFIRISRAPSEIRFRAVASFRSPFFLRVDSSSLRVSSIQRNQKHITEFNLIALGAYCRVLFSPMFVDRYLSLSSGRWVDWSMSAVEPKKSLRLVRNVATHRGYMLNKQKKYLL